MPCFPSTAGQDGRVLGGGVDLGGWGEEEQVVTQ